MNKHVLRPLAAALALAFALPALADKQLGEVTVSSGRSVGAKPVLRDEIVATESIGARELEKTGATMLTEALDKRPGISVQTECSICNVRNVVLNNLPGRYTTLLIDGIPIFSSVSTAYGLDSVNLGGIERIDISRGAGSSLIAPEALAGSVNIVTRRPLKDEFMANQQFGSFGQWNTDLFGAKTFTEQYILSEILAGEITRATARPTRIVASLGSTVAFDALAAGGLVIREGRPRRSTRPAAPAP